MYKIILPFMLKASPEVLFAVIRELTPTDTPLFKPDNSVAILASWFDGKNEKEVYDNVHEVFRIKADAKANAIHFTQKEDGRWYEEEKTSYTLTMEDIKRLCWISYSEGRLGLKTSIEEDQISFNEVWKRSIEWYSKNTPVTPPVNYDTPAKGDELLK